MFLFYLRGRYFPQVFKNSFLFYFWWWWWWWDWKEVFSSSAQGAKGLLLVIIGQLGLWYSDPWCSDQADYQDHSGSTQGPWKTEDLTCLLVDTRHAIPNTKAIFQALWFLSYIRPYWFFLHGKSIISYSTYSIIIHYLHYNNAAIVPDITNIPVKRKY